MAYEAAANDTTEVYGFSIKLRSDQDDAELEFLLEAARRATWNALHGPMYLGSGRFRPEREAVEEGALAEPRRAAQQCDGADDASRRS